MLRQRKSALFCWVLHKVCDIVTLQISFKRNRTTPPCFDKEHFNAAPELPLFPLVATVLLKQKKI